MPEKALKLTAMRADLLKICATSDEQGNKGIAPIFYRHFKPGSKRTLTILYNAGYVTYDAYMSAVATTKGENALADYEKEKE